MFDKRITFLTLILAIICVHAACAEAEYASELIPKIESRKLYPTPVDIVRWQIDLCVRVVENFVNTQLAILEDFRNIIASTAQTSIDATIRMIDTVIFGTIGTIRIVTEKLIDKGIDISECTVLNIDNLKILRRKLIVDEIQCVTSQATEFYDIIDGAVHNFTADLMEVLQLPVRFQKCFLNLLPISCISDLGKEVIELQKAIPRQILGTMLEVVQYLNGFTPRVHTCQFDELREAVVESRIIIDELIECIRYKGKNQLTSDILDDLNKLSSVPQDLANSQGIQNDVITPTHWTQNTLTLDENIEIIH